MKQKFRNKKFGFRITIIVFLATIYLVTFYTLLILIDISLPRLDFFDETTRNAKARFEREQKISSEMEKKLKIENPDLLDISLPVYYSLEPYRSIVKKHIL